ncbi:MAG: tRNA 4-thiouridine(8) synthase ThiI [Elusimicrobia bacterium]|nr:tRNA 4-thiouridine(8) synthase ThiI [Elusimicrobiota bacterium]MBK8126120.1 tRNA 4-thiouridine(8) synthase ThiI [Elusimicrobiota bacterium]MBK9056656.1 tRNA 4-thiouridine(8) synthase ThiI [Elusimicrobiota bacterium]MBP8004861.1 tRNA 4-thiouridine(8) synthase ThiI [Elusimicrobiota bacterium]
MNETVVIHYSELGTKGRNRRMFENKLADDVRRRLGPDALKVRIESARVLADLAPDVPRDRVAEALKPIFGIAWYGFGRLVRWSAGDPAWDAVETAVLELVGTAPEAKTFKIFPRRSAKNYPALSDAIARRLGQAVVDKTGLKVDLTRPDLSVHVEVLTREIAVLSDRVQGLRGMPRGSAGGVLCLFSGGIDSPVAAWLMMKRGAVVHHLHFHPHRSSREVLGTKIPRLVETLNAFGAPGKLYLVPHDRYQIAASLAVPTEYETVFFRRFMFRAGAVLARRLGLKALVTGDSLGQVASQTLENLTAVQTDLPLPVFQPLIAMDKEAIIEVAQKIGTYAPSIEAYKDCCSLMAKKPKTKVATPVVRRLESELMMDRLIEESLAQAEVWDGRALTALPPARSGSAAPVI